MWRNTAGGDIDVVNGSYSWAGDGIGRQGFSSYNAAYNDANSSSYRNNCGTFFVFQQVIINGVSRNMVVGSGSFSCYAL